MMAVKVFRLHKEGSTSADWHESVAYNDGVIQQIPDPAGDTAKRQITSIPSPLARIDLVKTAFQQVTQKKQLEGNTIYHRMVSECLDIGEIFFNIDKLKDKVSIVSWDKVHDLDKLLNSNNSKHRLLGRTLDLFLKQDAKTYNFDELKKIYLLRYTANGKILGGTSPVTLFFSAADDLSFVDIKFMDDRLFDEQYNPLYKRDPDYQKFLNHFIKAAGLAGKMKFFSDYLELSNKQAGLFNDINRLNPDEFKTIYAELNTGTEGDVVEVLGHPLGKRKKEDLQKLVADSSDFIIASDKYAGQKPLVLQNRFNKNLKYTNRLWDSHISVPYADLLPIPDRILPGCDIQYPYLTVSDFLEPHLLRLIFPINKTYYQTGNLSPEQGNHYVLPLKKAFFDFFDTEDLLKLINGKPMLEMQQKDKQVDVSLRIPLKKSGEFVTFARIYSESDIITADEANNVGKIVEKSFSLVIFPCFKVKDLNNHYRVMLIDTTRREPDYRLSFHQNAANQTIKTEHEALRSDKAQNDNVTTRFFVLEQNFDYIQVEHAGATGIIIPIFKALVQGSETFTFAVDFGTTNTHIEYRAGNDASQPFEITEKDMQIATLHDPAYQAATRGFIPIAQQFLHEFIPYKLENKGEYKFPQRTILAQSTTWKQPNRPYVLAEFNIPFTYEKRFVPKDSKLVSDLKWSDNKDEEARIRIQNFLEVILYLIRNKILLNGGNLAQTKLIWFYPSSMGSAKIATLEHLWEEELCKKYLHKDVQPKKLLEAIAPFYYHKKAHGVLAADKPVASIDIGGGTTDIVIFENDKPKLSTSFKFAGNTVFGDGYSGSLEKNGFYCKYRGRILDALKNDPDLTEAIRDIEKSDKSADVITAYFSLEKNKGLQDRKIEIPFSKWLAADGQLKIVFLVFYGAIIYHLAQFMKANNFVGPDFITFSGSASKILNLADPSKNWDGLAKLAQLIFQDIYADDSTKIGKIVLKKNDIPKEITCKGGVLAMDIEQLDNVKSIFLGSDALDKLYQTGITYAQMEKDSYIKDEIINQVTRFLELFFDLHRQMNFKEFFEIESALLNNSKQILSEHLRRFLEAGYNKKLLEIKGNESDQIDETLFFYPLVGALHELASNYTPDPES